MNLDELRHNAWLNNSTLSSSSQEKRIDTPFVYQIDEQSLDAIRRIVHEEVNIKGRRYTNSSDWVKLTPSERIEVEELRDKVLQYLISETEAFYKQFPGLQVNWSFGLDATVREDNP